MREGKECSLENSMLAFQVFFSRCWTSFSKSVVMHEASLLLFLHRYNIDRAILFK